MFRKPFFFSFLALCLFLFGARVATATTAVQPSDVELVVSARAIVTGEVTEISTAVQNGIVFSYIRLRVEEVLKGNGLASELVLKQPGGEAGDLGTLIYGMPRFETGKKVLLYLDTWPDGTLRVHQWFLGKFTIQQDPSSEEPIVVRDEIDGAEIRVRAGVVSTRLAFLSSYKEMVARLLAENAARASSFEHETYGDSAMLAQPPEFAAMHAHGQITPQWVSLNPAQPPRWFEPDSNQPVTFYINPDGAPASATDDVNAALATWSQATPALRLVLGGATTSCGISNADGRNSISFNNCDNYFSHTDGCSGILGIGGIIRYQPSQSKAINGMMFYKATEGKVSINPYGLCNITSRCDLQEILTHEIGHTLGMGHSSDNTATMWAAAHFDNRCAYLLGDDIDGIRFIYPSATGGGNLSITTASNLPTATMNQPYTSRLDAAGGAGGYSWSVTAGRLPNGLRLTANGSLLGMPVEMGTFNFSAQVTDSSGRTSQSSFALTVHDSSASPLITAVDYRKKKIFISGSNFSASGQVYVDNAQVEASINDGQATTGKKKLHSGAHEVYLVNMDNKQSNHFTFVIP